MGNLSIEDYTALSGLVFEWADSYDSKVVDADSVNVREKDWDRLKSILAPELLVDYSALGGLKTEAMPAADFVSMASGPKMFGDALLRTQHLVGASKWEKQSDDTVIGHHQVRSTSSRLASAGSKEETVVNQRRVVIVQTYTRVNGEWKLAGLKPLSR